MSVRCLSRVWDSSAHSGTALLMMLAIADFADDDGNAYPSVGTLATKCRMKVRNAQYLLTVLRASGELDIGENKGPRGCNRYRIRLVQPTAPLQAAAPVQPTAPLQAVAPGGAKHCAIGVQSTAPEPSLNRQEPSSLVRSSRAQRVAAHRQAEHPLFAEFYAAYPRKVARGAAAKAFKAAKPDRTLLDKMLTAIEAQDLAAKCAAGDERFVPYPATWLNGLRWLDGKATNTQSAPGWLSGTGFPNVFAAESAGCGPGNASKFRNGKRVAA